MRTTAVVLFLLVTGCKQKPKWNPAGKQELVVKVSTCKEKERVELTCDAAAAAAKATIHVVGASETGSLDVAVFKPLGPGPAQGHQVDVMQAGGTAVLEGGKECLPEGDSRRTVMVYECR